MTNPPTAAPGVADLIPRSVLTLAIHRLRAVANGNALPALADVVADELQAALLAGAAGGEVAGHFLENFGEDRRWQQCKNEMPGMTRPLYAHPPVPVRATQEVTEAEVTSFRCAMSWRANELPDDQIRHALEIFAASRLVTGALPAADTVAWRARLTNNPWVYTDTREAVDGAIGREGWEVQALALAATPPSAAPAGEFIEITDMLKLESMEPVEGLDEIVKHYETTFGRTPDAFMGKVVAETKERLFMGWGAHRDAIRAALVAQAGAAPAEPSDGQNLFEFWWAEYLADASRARAWEAFEAAPRARNVGIAALPAGEVQVDAAHHGLDNDKQVLFYEQDFYVLSNFSSFNVKWRGETFATSEHAYHWAKFHDHPDAINAAGRIEYQIQRAPSAHEAFKIAEGCKPRRRPDWDEVKVDIMREIIRAKADQHEYVRRKLIATGNRELIENSWRDDYWGWGPNRDGKNMLGKLWMEVRAAIASTTPPVNSGGA